MTCFRERRLSICTELRQWKVSPCAQSVDDPPGPETGQRAV
jgi:hypothetical protein